MISSTRSRKGAPASTVEIEVKVKVEVGLEVKVAVDGAELGEQRSVLSSVGSRRGRECAGGNRATRENCFVSESLGWGNSDK